LGELGDLATVTRTLTLQDTQTVAVLSGILECPHHDELESKKREAFDSTLFASPTGQRLEPCRGEKLRRQARTVATVTIKVPPSEFSGSHQP